MVRLKQLKSSGVNETEQCWCVCACVCKIKQGNDGDSEVSGWVGFTSRKSEQFPKTKVCFIKKRKSAKRTSCTFSSPKAASINSLRAHETPDTGLDLLDPRELLLLLLLFIKHQGWKIETCMTLLERESEQSVEFLYTTDRNVNLCVICKEINGDYERVCLPFILYKHLAAFNININISQQSRG